MASIDPPSTPTTRRSRDLVCSGAQDAAVRWEHFFARARRIDWERLRAPR